jgi:hypothetical protein
MNDLSLSKPAAVNDVLVMSPARSFADPPSLK